MKAFLTDMMAKNDGHIVTVGSVAGMIGTYGCTDYSATKFACAGFHESLFTELRVRNYFKLHLICTSLNEVMLRIHLCFILLCFVTFTDSWL